MMAARVSCEPSDSAVSEHDARVVASHVSGLSRNPLRKKIRTFGCVSFFATLQQINLHRTAEKDN